jgi:hypothetical protein
LNLNSGVNGANGLDVGVVAVASWYAVHIIDGPTVVPAGLFSLSPTAPTLPAGYTVFRRVGWARTAPGSTNFRTGQLQGAGRSREFFYNAVVSVLAGGAITGTWTNVSCVHALPPIHVRGAFTASQTTRGGPNLLIRPLGFGNSAAGLIIVPGAAAAPSPIPATKFYLVTGSPVAAVQTIQYQNDAGGGTSDISVLGYIDEI